MRISAASKMITPYPVASVIGWRAALCKGGCTAQLQAARPPPKACGLDPGLARACAHHPGNRRIDRRQLRVDPETGRARRWVASLWYPSMENPCLAKADEHWQRCLLVATDHARRWMCIQAYPAHGCGARIPERCGLGQCAAHPRHPHRRRQRIQQPPSCRGQTPTHRAARLRCALGPAWHGAFACPSQAAAASHRVGRALQRPSRAWAAQPSHPRWQRPGAAPLALRTARLPSYVPDPLRAGTPMPSMKDRARRRSDRLQKRRHNQPEHYSLRFACQLQSLSITSDSVTCNRNRHAVFSTIHQPSRLRSP